MITFTSKDDNKQFISIQTNHNENINKIIESLKNQYPSLKQLHIVFDESEVIIEINNDYDYNFSLNELREYLKPIAKVTVTHFAVDIDEPSQRYYG